MTAAEYIVSRILHIQREVGITPNVIDVDADFWNELQEELGDRSSPTCKVLGVVIIKGYTRSVNHPLYE